MNKTEIRALLKSKREELKELRAANDAADTLEKVKEIGQKMDEVVNLISDLQTQLEELDEEEEQSRRGNVSRGFNHFAACGGELRADGSRVVASATYGGRMGSFTGNSEGLALRGGETFASRFGVNDAKPLNLGKYVRGIVTGNWENAQEERAAVDTGAVGTLIPQVLSAQIVDMARNVSLFTSAGVPLYPMKEGNLTIARVKTDPVIGWKAEGAEAQESTFELDHVKLQAKTIYGYAYVTLEAIQSARNLESIMYQVFSQALADAIDRGILYGDGTDHAPAGILNDSAVNVITASNVRYNDFLRAIGAIRQANGTPTVYGINADTETILNMLQDTSGKYLEMPGAVASLERIVTNQLKTNGAQGADAIVFDPNALAIGIQNQIMFRFVTDSDECLKKGLVALQIYANVDGLATRPKHISHIKGIKEAAAVDTTAEE